MTLPLAPDWVMLGWSPGAGNPPHTGEQPHGEHSTHCVAPGGGWWTWDNRGVGYTDTVSTA